MGDAALPRGKAPPLRLILSGIESRIGRVQGLNAIARAMGLRPDRLRRLFRREMGGETSVYLRKRRMDIARKVDVAVPATLSVGSARKVPDAAGTSASTN